MAVINKTGITNGTTIQAEHVTRAIDALSGGSTDTVIASGSFSGSLTGNATTATSATNATNATNTAVTNTSTGTGPYYITFVESATGNVAQRVDATGLTYNATTDTITATASYATTALSSSYAVTASRAVTASFADLSRQVLVQRTAANADYFMVIVDSGNLTPTAENLNTVTNIRVNPGSDTISAVIVSGSFNVTGSLTAKNSANINFSDIGSQGNFSIPFNAPSAPNTGSMYWDDAAQRLYIYGNQGWVGANFGP